MADRTDPPFTNPIFITRTEHQSSKQKNTGLEPTSSMGMQRVTTTTTSEQTTTTTDMSEEMTSTIRYSFTVADPSQDILLSLSSLDSDLSSASLTPLRSNSPTFKRETSTVANFFNIRPTYIPRKTNPSTEKKYNQLLDPNVQPISKKTDSKAKIQKASLFPGKSTASKTFHNLALWPLFLIALLILL